MANIFDTLAEQIKATPEAIKKEYEDITIKTLDLYFDKFEKKLKDTSGSEDLNNKMTVRQPEYERGDYYIRSLDWDDETIVNVDKGKSYGQQAERVRERGKRNYSVYPATYHDLAYILNYGHGGQTGTHFIDQAKRSLKRWEKARDKAFEKYLDGIEGK